VSTSATPEADTRSAYPDDLRELADDYLASLSFSAGPETDGLDAAMRYSLLAGGKRIRPVLALATAHAVGMPTEAVLPLAGALELIHTYSLIHDDLPAMDDDSLRRGRPTCHVRYGEAIAILAGDALYAEAIRLVLAELRADPGRIIACLCELTAASGVQGMVGGQYIDVSGTVESDGAELRRLHELKTGRLIGAAIECVLLLTDDHTRSTTLPDFRAFATELGVLFQIVDDILDVTGTDVALGKPQGSDERHGKVTYVSRYGLDGARAMAQESHRNARAALDRAAPDSAGELIQITDFIANRTS
jgi:geranylgeranyl diphosphate synthase, type II